MKFLSISDLHSNPSWMEWILEKSPHYDAILFPGDLLMDVSPDFAQAQLRWIGELARKLLERGVSFIGCSGNHDDGLDKYLRSLHLPIAFDGDREEIAGVSIRCIGWGCRLPYSRDTIWLYHKPPDITPVASTDSGSFSCGCPDLLALTYTDPDRLPPLVICGHVHRPQHWYWKSGRTLFLNSGQNLYAPEPRFLDIEIADDQARIQFGRECLVHPLK